MITEGKILLFIAINILAVAIVVVNTLPYGYGRPPSVKIEERKPYKGTAISDSRIDIESSFRGGEYEQDMEIERGFPNEVMATRKPYVPPPPPLPPPPPPPPPIIEPRGRGYEGIGRNGGGRRISYGRTGYK